MRGAGCARQVTAPGRVLCREHRRRQRVTGDLPLQQFLALPQTVPLPPTGPCQVTACPRDRTSRTRYCEAHQYQLRIARRRPAGTSTRSAGGGGIPGPGGRAGQPARASRALAAEVLYGLQQRTRAGSPPGCTCSGRWPRSCAGPGHLARDRRCSPAGPMAREKGHPALTGPPCPAAARRHRRRDSKDVWDLAAFGSRGQLSFTGISQGWLRQAAKRWAADDLPRHRGRPPARPGPAHHQRRRPGCRRTCAPPATITASCPPPSAAATSSRSCTAWPTWNQPGSSAGTGGSGSARISSGRSAASARSAWSHPGSPRPGWARLHAHHRGCPPGSRAARTQP